ncbi:isopropanol dehydrogenase [Zopfia rhizophila CBS 207.26]|uniref:Isopropanol dehydrogenase n=1 Tax=Zopfia rhizophila CBS 207.26 TaxID=1314779 RepID=A0A6A6DTI5_9PEZI|nr:isopropanol dehydrogenase [Zopfia rhizophila CBS 207.26]
MSTHKALVLESFSKPITLQTITTPKPTIGSALIRPLYAPLQSYSRIIFAGQFPSPLTLPFTPGSSCVARIESVAPDATSLKPGDIVFVDPTISSRDDPDTQMLLALFAGGSDGSKKLMTDAWRNGCFSQKAIVPLENCYKLPERLFKSEEEGGQGYEYKHLAILTLILVAYGGLESAGVGAGTTVIVAPSTGKFSGGAVLVALAMGAKVVAASRNGDAMEKLYGFPGAKERLTTVKLVSDVEKDTAALMAATGGKGAHVYIDFTPPAATGPSPPPHITACINALRRNGQAVLMGGLPSDVSINYTQLLFKNITVRGKMMYEREQVQRFIRMLENGNLALGDRVGLNVAGVFGLEDVEKALDVAEKGTGWGNDVLLAPNRE